MKMPNRSSSCSPRSVFFFILCFLLLPLSLLLLLLLVVPSSSSSSSSSSASSSSSSHGGDRLEAEKVTVSVYYETLCPYCAEFIVNHLVRIFQTGLISIVNLAMIPWGNAFITPDGSFLCQHGEEECLLNTVEACTIKIYPDVMKHFRFIHCVERVTLEKMQNQWVNCFQMSGLDSSPLDCYSNGSGRLIEQIYANQTAQLDPPIRFVPWVVVDNHSLQEDYPNFLKYICAAFKGNPKPDACLSLSVPTTTDSNHYTNSFIPVCHASHYLPH
ncbi:gamma-interferon-responsive lysosomal thiol protein-like isoform X1 [Prosopis cineraria]|uniref:gamma-interferon-responsive lysosomal thiol protein-like isoform X1 n=1 Tax=Prosopis cineraria TaxID=364024 RepID=UPI00240F0F94|nr:gamma-interferon-responsive lysosomal thiol protein-like isoform X1 [Prosopis cineraria]